MRRASGINVSSAVRSDAKSRSPGRVPGDGSRLSQRERFLSPLARDSSQDAAILQSAFSDDVMIRQGKALLKPSEIRNRTPGKKRLKDWGECPLTFDAIKEPVRAADGNVYERWAIKKWLEENGNRSPLTNVIINPSLTPLLDSEEGTVKGSRHISPDKTKESIKTEINTVLNAVRDAPGISVDEEQYVDVPSKPSSPRLSAPATRPTGLTALLSSDASASDERKSSHSSASVPAAGSGGSSDGKAAEPLDRNKMIAALMRDTSLSAAERNAKIQALRAGKDITATEEPKVLPDTLKPVHEHKPPLPSQAGAAAENADSAPRSDVSIGRSSSSGAVKRAQEGLSSTVPAAADIDDVRREKDNEDLRMRDAEEKRLAALKRRGFSGFDPGDLDGDAGAPGHAQGDGPGHLPPKTDVPAPAHTMGGEGPRINTDLGGERSSGVKNFAKSVVAESSELAGDGEPGVRPQYLAREASSHLDPRAKRGVEGGAEARGGVPHASAGASSLPVPQPDSGSGGGSEGGRSFASLFGSSKGSASSKPLLATPKVSGADGEERGAGGSAGHSRSGSQAHGNQNGEFADGTGGPGKGSVGVGITFGQFHKDHVHAGALYVKQLQAQGPAQQSGMVQKGDILFEIQGVNCYRRSIDRIQERLLGPEGSQVALVFKRPSPSMDGRGETGNAIDTLPAVVLTLQRRAPPPGHHLGVVEEPRHASRRDAAGTEGGSGGFGNGDNWPSAAPVSGPAAAAKSVARGSMGGRKLHADLMQVLEIQAEKPPEMRSKGELLDMVFVCNDGTVVKAHRLLMAASSSLLRALIAQHNTQGLHGASVTISNNGELRVTLEDEACGGPAMESLVRFMYAGKLRVEGALDLVHLFRVARFLQVASLQEASEDGLLAMLNTTTCAHLLVLAHSEGCRRVLDACHVYALQNFEAVAASVSFADVDESLVEAMVRSESLVAKDEEAVFEALFRWMSCGHGGGGVELRGQRICRHIRFGTMRAQYLREVLGRPLIRTASKLRSYIEQGLAVQESGAKGQSRPLMGKGVPSSASAKASDPVAPNMKDSLMAQANALGGRGGGAQSMPRFAFDSSRSHPNHQILEGGMLAVLLQDGDSEHSAMLLPAVKRAARSYVEFLIENSGTPDCYVQLGVCTGQHDVMGGTPAYQSDSGWCFSCHNGNLLHYDQGSEYSNKLPRAGDRVGLLVDLVSRTLEVFVNSVGQGVMVRGLPDTLYFVVDAGDKGQTIRVLPNTPPPEVVTRV